MKYLILNPPAIIVHHHKKCHHKHHRHGHNSPQKSDNSLKKSSTSFIQKYETDEPKDGKHKKHHRRHKKRKYLRCKCKGYKQAARLIVKKFYHKGKHHHEHKAQPKVISASKPQPVVHRQRFEAQEDEN